MSYRRESKTAELIAKLIVLAVMVGIGWGFSAWKCAAQFGWVGPTSWGPIQGCIVTLPNGAKRPAGMLRDLQP